MTDQTEEVETSSANLPAAQSENASSGISKPVVALVAAGVVGLAIGAIVMRRRSPQRFAAVDRAIDLARTGSYRKYSSLKRRLRDEGYAPDQIEGRARRYIGDLLQTAAERIRP